MEIKKFHDIESLRHIKADLESYREYSGEETLPTILFRGTVKLHGTNGAVRIKGADVMAHGRNQVLTIEKDSYDFAKFVQKNELDFRMLAVIATKSITSEVTIYGEWCGQGIQKSVAVSSLPRMFVVFAVFDHTKDDWVNIHDIAPSASELTFLNENNIYLVTQAPTFVILVDFNNPKPAAEILQQYTDSVAQTCPFASAVHGVEGAGEGIVWVSEGYRKRLVFKTKAEKFLKHHEPRTAVPVDPEKVASIAALSDLLLPDWRLEQGVTYLRDNGHPLTERSTGVYLKWIIEDILKEEADRIEANPYPWKDIQKVVSNQARKFYFGVLDEALVG